MVNHIEFFPDGNFLLQEGNAPIHNTRVSQAQFFFSPVIGFFLVFPVLLKVRMILEMVFLGIANIFEILLILLPDIYSLQIAWLLSSERWQAFLHIASSHHCNKIYTSKKLIKRQTWYDPTQILLKLAAKLSLRHSIRKCNAMRAVLHVTNRFRTILYIIIHICICIYRVKQLILSFHGDYSTTWYITWFFTWYKIPIEMKPSPNQSRQSRQVPIQKWTKLLVRKIIKNFIEKKWQN